MRLIMFNKPIFYLQKVKNAFLFINTRRCAISSNLKRLLMHHNVTLMVMYCNSEAARYATDIALILP